MERRTYATFMRQWPNKQCIVTSPAISFDEYPNDVISYSDLINVMLGDLQRIRVYPDFEYAIEQSIPDDVWLAFQSLVDIGFTEHLLSDG